MIATILIVIVALIAAMLIYAATKPNTFLVRRTRTSMRRPSGSCR